MFPIAPHVFPHILCPNFYSCKLYKAAQKEEKTTIFIYLFISGLSKKVD
jgi:hypothetical protein